MKRLALLLALIALPAQAQIQAQAEAPAPAPACPFPGQSPMLVVQLFFGQSLHGGGLISRRAWARFVADSITPALPGGFTIYDAYGQWQDPATRVIAREPAEVLLVAAPDSPAFRTAIAAIADTYRRRFDQRSVGIVSTGGCGAF